MVTFGVVTDTRLARVLGFNSSAAALMLRPLNTSLVCTVCLFIFRFFVCEFFGHVFSGSDCAWNNIFPIVTVLIICLQGHAGSKTLLQQNS